MSKTKEPKKPKNESAKHLKGLDKDVRLYWSINQDANKYDTPKEADKLSSTSAFKGITLIIPPEISELSAVAFIETYLQPVTNEEQYEEVKMLLLQLMSGTPDIPENPYIGLMSFLESRIKEYEEGAINNA